MSTSACSAKEIDEVCHVFKHAREDDRLIAYTQAIADSVRAGRAASCETVTIRIHDATVVDLMPNGILLGGQDTVFLHRLGESTEGNEEEVRRELEAYHRRAEMWAEGMQPDPLEDKADVVTQLCLRVKCGYWLTKAAALKKAVEIKVPVTAYTQEVRVLPRKARLATRMARPALPCPVESRTCKTDLWSPRHGRSGVQGGSIHGCNH